MRWIRMKQCLPSEICPWPYLVCVGVNVPLISSAKVICFEGKRCFTHKYISSCRLVVFIFITFTLCSWTYHTLAVFVPLIQDRTCKVLDICKRAVTDKFFTMMNVWSAVRNMNTTTYRKGHIRKNLCIRRLKYTQHTHVYTRNVCFASLHAEIQKIWHKKVI